MTLQGRQWQQLKSNDYNKWHKSRKLISLWVTKMHLVRIRHNNKWKMRNGSQILKVWHKVEISGRHWRDLTFNWDRTRDSMVRQPRTSPK